MHSPPLPPTPFLSGQLLLRFQDSGPGMSPMNPIAATYLPVTLIKLRDLSLL